MTDEKWQQMWDAAQTVQQRLYVDEIVPRRLTVDEFRVEVAVEWTLLGWAASTLFDNAETLPVEKFSTANYNTRSVSGVACGAKVTIIALRERDRLKPAGTVADLLAGEQR